MFKEWKALSERRVGKEGARCIKIRYTVCD
jgi:hypothetical protein